MLRAIISKAIQKGKINSESQIVDVLRKSSWLGGTIKRPDEEYSWINLIAPAINDYFIQLQFYYHNRSNHINLVLCIDSLTLKIEGIVRDICDLAGGTTFYFTQDKKGRQIAREKDINALLHEETIKNLFSQDDLLFLKFLLVEKSGLNLRNYIAHGLFREIKNYSIEYMNLLVLAILKLAKNEYGPIKRK